MSEEKDGLAGLRAELMGEAALTLGNAGKKLQAALDALAAFDAGTAPPTRITRPELVDDAAERTWELVIVRGAMGWQDEEATLQAYAVPREVRARMGATLRKTG